MIRSVAHPIAKSPPVLRWGMTLIEMLIVMAVIGLLTAILLPAVMAAQGAARRIQCSANLNQIVHAATSYLSQHECTVPMSGRGVERYNSPAYHSAFVFLLPYLEQQGLYDSFNHELSSEAVENATVAYTRMSLFLCPADGVNNTYLVNGQDVADVNYSINSGWPLFSTGVAGERYANQWRWCVSNGYVTILGSPMSVVGGATTWPGPLMNFETAVTVRSRDFVDGTHKTAAFSERLINPGETDSSDDRRVHYLDKARTAGTQRQLLDRCQQQGLLSSYSKYQGVSWAWNFGKVGTYYVHLDTPNGRNCHWTADEASITGITASSNHGGGANVAFADGHIEWIDSSIDHEIWWKMGSRNNRY